MMLGKGGRRVPLPCETSGSPPSALDGESFKTLLKGREAISPRLHGQRARGETSHPPMQYTGGAAFAAPEAVDKEGSTAFFVEFGIKQFRRKVFICSGRTHPGNFNPKQST